MHRVKGSLLFQVEFNHLIVIPGVYGITIREIFDDLQDSNNYWEFRNMFLVKIGVFFIKAAGWQSFTWKKKINIS